MDNIGIGDAALAAGNLDQSVTLASGPTLSAVVSFDGTDGSNPQAGLILDAAGDLLGTTDNGGANTVGTVFEIANTATGYASTPTDLASFDSGTGYNLAWRPARQRRRRPVRHHTDRRGERRRHGVRDRQHRHRLRQRADRAGQFQRHDRRSARMPA